MKIAILLNKSRVTDELVNKLNDPEFSIKMDLAYELFIVDHLGMESTLRMLNVQSYSGFLICGGDGTVRSAAEFLVDFDLPMAILPLGTFNLLAKSLDHINDIEAIFTMIKNNKTKMIDLGAVNEKIFINHVWIGFYYQILKLRKKHQVVIGKSKVLKTLFGVLNLFKPLSFYDLKLKIDDKMASFRTCLLFVSNNESYLNLFDFGEHKSLNSGRLQVVILNSKTRLELFLCLLHMLVGGVKKSKYYSQFSTDAFTISSNDTLSNIVIDGDLFKLNNPLSFVNHQKKLKVFIP